MIRLIKIILKVLMLLAIILVAFVVLVLISGYFLPYLPESIVDIRASFINMIFTLTGIDICGVL